jgi:AraC-like DNA-binding protein
MVLPEIVAVGIYNSAVEVKNRAVTKNRITTMFELEIPIETGGISYIDNEATAITPDMVICARPGQTRHTRLPFKCYYIHMILHEGELYELLMRTPSFIPIEEPEEYKRIFEQLCSYESAVRPEEKTKLYSLVLELIYLFARDANKNARVADRGSVNKAVIEETVAYINDHPDADLSLEALAARANLSAIHFHNCFKAASGRTLHRFVEERRLKHAMELLLSTDMTLTEIAFTCGFSSQSYFSYVFKRSTGLTPRAYAKSANSRYRYASP